MKSMRAGSPFVTKYALLGLQNESLRDKNETKIVAFRGNEGRKVGSANLPQDLTNKPALCPFLTTHEWALYPACFLK